MGINHVFRKMPRKIDVKTLALFVLTMVILIEILFIWFFINKQNPVIGFSPVKLPGVDIPSYLYSLGLQENNPDSGLDSPLDVAVDGQGRAFVVDVGHNCIKVYNSYGQYQFKFGKPGIEPGEFTDPVGISINGDQVYVTETGNQRVQVFDLKGKFKKVLIDKKGNSGSGGLIPCGITALDNGDVYITDIFQHRVVCIGPDGKIKQTFGGSGEGPGKLAYPNDVIVDGDKVFVSDSNNARVQVFNKNGKFIKILEDKDPNKKLTLPRGLALYKDDILVVDTFGQSVFVMNEKGKVLDHFGEYGSQNNQFNYPNGLALFQNKVFVTDRANNRVSVFSF